MTWAGLDQRAFPRVSAKLDIWIGDQTGNTIHAKTQNLGGGGACVLLNRELEKLSQVNVRLTLDNPAAPIECMGRVVWVVRSKEPASGKVTFDVGLEFLNLKNEDRHLILSYVRRYQQ